MTPQTGTDIDQSWIDEQMKHFPDGSMDGAVRLLLAYERADRERGGTRGGEGQAV